MNCGRLLRTTTGAIVIDSVQTVLCYTLILDYTGQPGFGFTDVKHIILYVLSHGTHHLQQFCEQLEAANHGRCCGGGAGQPSELDSVVRAEGGARRGLGPNLFVNGAGTSWRSRLDGLQDRAATDAAKYEAG